MSTVQTNDRQTSTQTYSLTSNILGKIRSWLSVWEMYPILLIAAFLRFYQINTTEVDDDQATVFRMAHDAIVHGLIPATANIASIRLVNPPAVIYLFMFPAAFSANPLWGNIFVALFNVVAVLLTYIFVRRYYGRLAAVISSLLYATAFNPIYYSRVIWQLNLDAPFVVLFIFALFWGVVDRRKGWLFPALLLLGILFQLQETTIILIVPLLVAILLAPGTVRWRDLALGVASLLLIFFTYLLWEFYTKFADLNVLIQFSKLHAHVDTLALNYYRLFLDPYNNTPTNTHSLLYMLVPYIGWLHRFMLLLILCGFATATLGVILLSLPNSRKGGGVADRRWGRLSRPILDESPQSRRPLLAGFNALLATWTAFRATPRRCGYLMLLTWQIVPVLILSRHAVPLFPYYLLMVMPGPFILIGLFLSTLVSWLQRQRRRWNVLRYGVYAITSLVIVALLLGSFAAISDETNGNNPHGYSFNTLNSLQDALAKADQLALHQHLNHVYITTDMYTQAALRYLAEQMQTPTTLFDASRCLVLPDPAAGPAVLLVGPDDRLTGALLGQFAIATLVDQPERLGGAPFHLYIVRPMGVPTPNTTNVAFVNNLLLFDNQARQLSFDNSTWLATHWSFIRSAAPDYRTTYTYAMTALLHGNANDTSTISSQCVSTSMRAGDQLIVAFQQPHGKIVPASVTISAQSYTTMPLNISYGPFRLENIRDQRTQPSFLQTSAGTPGITLSI
jgi:4-amino-4-deoxy-L-arabinose transferase-like glycosyltransferase